jgi:2-(3-amino-3-carboxypropyl)histidine synthase
MEQTEDTAPAAAVGVGEPVASPRTTEDAPPNGSDAAASVPTAGSGDIKASKKPSGRRFVGKSGRSKKNVEGGGREVSATALAKREERRKAAQLKKQIPDEILHDALLNDAIKRLPANYKFEIHKTVWRIKQANSKHVALQFPEGLLMYACVISDILEHFAGVEEVVILGDVAYGACCVDDFSARAVGCDFMVHYGHSCLVPINKTSLTMLYVFVEIEIDIPHLIECVKKTFPPETKMAVLGTIQFGSSVFAAKEVFEGIYSYVYVPQVKPLSPGEVLGCTSPILTGVDVLVFVADGRFHMESTMIANPELPAYRYNPYNKTFSIEKYDTQKMFKGKKYPQPSFSFTSSTAAHFST